MIRRLTIKLSSGAEISFTLSKSTGMVVSSPPPAIVAIPLDELQIDFQHISDWLEQAVSTLGIPWGSLGDMHYETRDGGVPHRLIEVRRGATTLREYTYNKSTRVFSAPSSPAFSLTPIELRYWFRLMMTEMTVLAQV